METKIKNLEFNTEFNILFVNEEKQVLTKIESKLLSMLMGKPNELQLRDDILSSIWGKTDYFTGRSMDVYICKLRKFLKPLKNVQIVNKHGKGYVFEVTEE